MSPETAPKAFLRRWIVLLLAAFVLLVALAVGAPKARAYDAYVHGGIDSCAVCHQDNHTNWQVVSEVCNTCHLGFARPKASLTCWTCHTPVQDMTWARSDASCTAACHLANGTTSTHVAHPGRSLACSTCHALSASVTDAAGSPHHVLLLASAPVVTGFAPSAAAPGAVVTVSGSEFKDVFAVAFNGVPATVFKVVSGTQIAVIVPAGATTGPITVSAPGRTGTSATSFSVVTMVSARVTLSLTRPTVSLGEAVRTSGSLTPASLAGTQVGLTVRVRKSGAWRTAKRASVVAGSGGRYSWTYAPSRRGSYTVRASVAGTATHTAARSKAVSFQVR